MTEGLRQQIHDNLKLRGTDDLLEIWKTNDRNAWSDAAFEEISRILMERIGEVPVHGPPATSSSELDGEDGDLEDWEMAALDAEDQPAFYDVEEVISLVRKVRPVLIGASVVYAARAISEILIALSMLRSYADGPLGPQIARPILYLIAVLVGAALSIAIMYLGLNALASILRMLMEMEFTSRKGSADAVD